MFDGIPKAAAVPPNFGDETSCSSLFCLAVADAEEVGLAPQKHLAFGDGGRRHEPVIR
jgi:hypothetical protein